MNTKRARILEKIIAAGPAGCEKEDLRKALSISDTAVYNHVHYLRKHNDIRTEGSKYIIGTSTKVKAIEKETPTTEATEKETLGTDKQPEIRHLTEHRGSSPDILKYLSTHPNGVLTGDMCEAFSITKSVLFSRLHLLRCKGNKILLKDGKYILKELAGTKEHSNAIQDDGNLKSLLGSINMKDLNALEPTERSDCLDMLKKSLFYRKSAEAMIQTSKIIRNITEN